MDDMKKMKEKFRGYGLSQNQVAECVGLTGPLISQIFSGKIRPSAETEYRLERLLCLCATIRRMVLKRISGGDDK